MLRQCRNLKQTSDSLIRHLVTKQRAMGSILRRVHSQERGVTGGGVEGVCLLIVCEYQGDKYYLRVGDRRQERALLTPQESKACVKEA